MSNEKPDNLWSTNGGNARAALIVAHPGHELKVHGWMTTARPRVCVITDGSGRTQESRLDSTTAVLTAAGCAAGPIYGVMTDQDLYTAVLNLNHEPFIQLVDELAEMFVHEDIAYVAGDAEERYNPAHDICRMIINAAVGLVWRREKREIKNFDFNLVGPPLGGSAAQPGGAIRIDLDKATLAQKLAAACNYPELQAEVSAALAGAGSVGFQQHPDLARQTGQEPSVTRSHEFVVEYLRPIDRDRELASAAQVETPFYELYGERQVLAGHYDRVLRYRDHLKPLSEAIQAHVERS